MLQMYQCVDIEVIFLHDKVVVDRNDLLPADGKFALKPLFDEVKLTAVVIHAKLSDNYVCHTTLLSQDCTTNHPRELNGHDVTHRNYRLI